MRHCWFVGKPVVTVAVTAARFRVAALAKAIARLR